MNSEHTLKLTNEFAPGYDNYIANKNWKGPTVIFDLLNPYIHKGDILLDIGIGTGLASLPFKNAGLRIFGIDGSEEMVKICSKKSFTEGLILSDISSNKLQLPDIEFNHIISNAVFHMIGNLEQIFKEASNHIKPNGCFCFTTFPLEADKVSEFKETKTYGIYSKINNDSGLEVYRHSNEYIKDTLYKNRFELISSNIFLGFSDNDENKKVFFEVFMARKMD